MQQYFATCVSTILGEAELLTHSVCPPFFSISGRPGLVITSIQLLHGNGDLRGAWPKWEKSSVVHDQC